LDSKFLRFWGHFLLQAAEGQKRFEDLPRWMTAGLSGSDDLAEMFEEAYGLKRKPGSDATPLGKMGLAIFSRRYRAAMSFGKDHVVQGVERVSGPKNTDDLSVLRNEQTVVAPHNDAVHGDVQGVELVHELSF